MAIKTYLPEAIKILVPPKELEDWLVPTQ